MKRLFSNKLILLLVLIAFLILGYPLFLFGVGKSFFFHLDPDIVYTTNALLYTKFRIISYIDHPGTPTIVYLSYLFIPFRLMAKYLAHQNFSDWSFNNFAFLVYYLRIFQLVLSGFSLFVFLKLIKNITNSKMFVVLGFCLAFSLAGFTSALSVAPEGFSLLLAAIWLTVFVKFAKTEKYFPCAILAAISGFAFANKFTNLFLVLISVFLPVFVKRYNLGKKIVMIEANAAIAIQAFLLGILPVINKLPSIINWGVGLFNHAGKYGYGTAAVFDQVTYLNSLSTLISGQPITYIFILLTFLLEVYLLLKKKLKVTDPVAFLGLTAFLGILVFSKYPAIHYNYINILLMVFSLVYFLTKVKIIWVKILIPVMAVVFAITSYKYIAENSAKLSGTGNGSVVEQLEAWTPTWSSDLFREQLDAAKVRKP